MTATEQLIHDTTIVTADETGSILYDARAARPRWPRSPRSARRRSCSARHPSAERVDGRGRAILPGLANTHTHLSRVLARGIYEDLSPPHTPPFTGGLAPLPLPALAPDEERVMVLLGALEAIRSGTTLVLEESAGLAGYAGAPRSTRGLRLVLCERAWDRAERVDRPARPVRARSGARRSRAGPHRRVPRALARQGRRARPGRPRRPGRPTCARPGF